MSKRLIIVWVALAALVIGLRAFERDGHLFESAEEHAAHTGVPTGDRRLMPAAIAEIGIIEIAYGGALHRFERDAQGAWFYHAHATNVQAVADHTHVADAQVAQRIEKAFAGLEKARLEREFPNDPTADFGVAAPEMFVVVYGRRPDGLPDANAAPLMRYALGNLAPDNLSRYVLPSGRPGAADSTTGSAKIVTIANYQFDNLANLIKDMQSATPGKAAESATAPAQ